MRADAVGSVVVALVHLGAVSVLFTGVTTDDLLLFPFVALFRAFTVSIGYHRYFAHRSFKTSRVFQFILGVICCTNMENGPLWWSAIHRHHHRHSDESNDYHSPVHGGFFWAHIGWVFTRVEEPNWDRIRDLRRFPELVWLERFWVIPPILVGFGFWLLGGWSMVCSVFCLTALITMHGTWAVNSFGHLFGSRRYATHDQSRNSYLLAFLTCGDGWHNNHHHYPHSAHHGFFWWEIDGAYNVIRLMALIGLVWDVRRIPPHKLAPTAEEFSNKRAAAVISSQSAP